MSSTKQPGRRPTDGTEAEGSLAVARSVDTAGQGALFPDDLPAATGDDVGYRGPTACSASGITYRQLDYWARTGLVVPSVRDAVGSGTHRLYSFRDILVLKLVKRLLDAGVSLGNVRAAIEHLRSRGIEDLSGLTLISDGATVYECTSADEVVDLLAGGQGVFGIAVGPVARETRGQLAELPSERREVEGEQRTTGSDELSRRRRRRADTA